MDAKKYLQNFIKNDRYLRHRFIVIQSDGNCKELEDEHYELKDGELYGLLFVLEHQEKNWKKEEVRLTWWDKVSAAFTSIYWICTKGIKGTEQHVIDLRNKYCREMYGKR